MVANEKGYKADDVVDGARARVVAAVAGAAAVAGGAPWPSNCLAMSRTDRLVCTGLLPLLLATLASTLFNGLRCKDVAGEESTLPCTFSSAISFSCFLNGGKGKECRLAVGSWRAGIPRKQVNLTATNFECEDPKSSQAPGGGEANKGHAGVVRDCGGCVVGKRVAGARPVLGQGAFFTRIFDGTHRGLISFPFQSFHRRGTLRRCISRMRNAR